MSKAYVRDGLYYYVLPTGVSTPMMRVSGPFTWRYVGQQLFADQPTRHRPAEWAPTNRSAHAPMSDAYFGVGRTTGVDGLGRRWILNGVDTDEFLRMKREQDQADLFEPGRRDVHRNDVATPPDPDDDTSFLVPLSWETMFCGQDDPTEHDLTDYSGDPFETVDPPMNDRQRKIVWFDAIDGQCSGTMVDDRWILSAAHCLADGSGNPQPVGSIRVCTLGNLDRYASGSHRATCGHATPDSVAVIGPDFDGTVSPTNDFAVFQFDTSPDPALFVPVPPKRRGSLTDTSLYRHVAATHALAA